LLLAAWVSSRHSSTTTKKKVMKILFGFVGLYSAFHLSYIVYHIYIFNLRDTFEPTTEMLQSRNQVGQKCNIGMESVTLIHNVHSFRLADEVIQENPWKPVLFKNFLLDPAGRWDEVEREYGNSTLTFSKLLLGGFGNTWVSGIKDVLDTVELPLSEYFETSSKLPSNESMYAAFLEFRHSPSRGNSPDDIFQNAFVDQGFLSNFREDLIATSIHAAPCTQSYTTIRWNQNLDICSPLPSQEV
jgi:hypothetical protein